MSENRDQKNNNTQKSKIIEIDTVEGKYPIEIVSVSTDKSEKKKI